MKHDLTLCFALLFCLSCSRVVFVNKKDVIYNQNGYILFYYEQEEALFFPFKDTIDAKFLGRSHLDGYKITGNERDLAYLKKLARSQTVVQNVLQNGGSIQVDESVKLLPVFVKYYWGENFALKLQKAIDNMNTIRFEYSNKDVELSYRIYDHRRIMSITPAKESDKKKGEQGYIPQGQLEE